MATEPNIFLLVTYTVSFQIIDYCDLIKNQLHLTLNKKQQTNKQTNI